MLRKYPYGCAQDLPNGERSTVVHHSMRGRQRDNGARQEDDGPLTHFVLG